MGFNKSNIKELIEEYCPIEKELQTIIFNDKYRETVAIKKSIVEFNYPADIKFEFEDENGKSYIYSAINKKYEVEYDFFYSLLERDIRIRLNSQIIITGKTQLIKVFHYLQQRFICVNDKMYNLDEIESIKFLWDLSSLKDKTLENEKEKA
jgi:hypothetical protein